MSICPWPPFTKNNSPSFSLGDGSPLSPVRISAATSNLGLDSSLTSFHGNCVTASSETSETLPAYVNFAASENIEIPAADVNFAFSSLFTHIKSSVRTENYFTQNQSCQSSWSSSTYPDRSVQVALQQIQASSQQLHWQNTSNTAIENFQLIGGEPTSRHQQRVPSYSLDTTVKEAWMNESSAIIVWKDNSSWIK